jgi:hypothetical protein
MLYGCVHESLADRLHVFQPHRRPWPGGILEGLRLRSSGCHGRGRSAWPRDDAPPAWRKPVSHGPAEPRVRERVVQDGHGEPGAMARTLLGARAGHGGRARLHGVPPARRGAHRPRPAAGGQRRRGRWQRPCALPILCQGHACRRASPCARCNASGARCTRAPYACCPRSRWGGGPVGTCSRGRFPRRKRADTEEGARARRARWSDPGCAGSGAPTAAAAGHDVAAALTIAPPSGIVVLHGGPADGERSSLWMPTSPTSHAPTAQSAGKEIPC